MYNYVGRYMYNILWFCIPLKCVLLWLYDPYLVLYINTHVGTLQVYNTSLILISMSIRFYIGHVRSLYIYGP